MTKVVLYDYWRSSAAYRVRIALNLLCIAYEAVPVNLLARAHRSSDHLARNPQGLVPVLDIDGLRLTQSLAIVEYLDETRPQARFLPVAPPERARLRAIAYAIAMEIHPVCNLAVANHAAGISGGGEEAKAAWMRHFIPPGLAAVERLLDHKTTGRFAHGAAPGMADICLVPQLYNARRWGIDLGAMPILSRLDAEAQKLDAFARAHPDRIGPPPQ
jgi:maleylacetoacetate isomerase